MSNWTRSISCLCTSFSQFSQKTPHIYLYFCPNLIIIPFLSFLSIQFFRPFLFCSTLHIFKRLQAKNESWNCYWSINISKIMFYLHIFLHPTKQRFTFLWFYSTLLKTENLLRQSTPLFCYHYQMKFTIISNVIIYSACVSMYGICIYTLPHTHTHYYLPVGKSIRQSSNKNAKLTILRVS